MYKKTKNIKNRKGILELKQISAIFGCYSKYFKASSLTWTAAYQRNRKDFSFLLIRQLSISDAGCHRGARKSIGMDVFWLPLSLFCLRFTGDRGLQILSSSGSNGRNFPSEALCKNKQSQSLDVKPWAGKPPPSPTPRGRVVCQIHWMAPSCFCPPPNLQRYTGHS